MTEAGEVTFWKEQLKYLRKVITRPLKPFCEGVSRSLLVEAYPFPGISGKPDIARYWKELRELVGSQWKAVVVAWLLLL